MADAPVVLHGKFSSWLPWHQPFLDDLLRGLDTGFRNVVLCNRTENAERFPRADILPLKTRALLQPAAAAVAASEVRRRFAPGLLHAHFGWSALRMLLLKRMLRVPLLVTFGGRDAGVQLVDPATAPLYELVLEAADRIFCVSAHLRELVLAAGAPAERVEVVHRGTDLALFTPAERARPAGAPLALLMVGRLVEKKGQRDAVRALARLAAQGTDARLTLVGDGPGRAALLEEAAQLGVGASVRVVGSVARSALAEHYAEADVLLHCSVTAADGDVEGLPNVVVEAAASGLPVLATRHGGLPEVVEHGRTGLLVDEGDAEALADALARLGRAPAERAGFGKAAAERARAHFDLAGQVRRHGEVYRELLAAGPGREVPLPDDFAERARRGAGVKTRPWDHALARAAAAACGDSDLSLLLRAAPRGLTDRMLEAPTAWVRPWRSAAELSLDLAAKGPPGAPLRAFRERSKRRGRALDLHVLEYLRGGGALCDVPSALAAPAMRDLAGEPAGPPTAWRRLRGRIASETNQEDDA